MADNQMQVRFLSLSQNEALSRTVAAAFAAQRNPTIEELTDIRTAVSEAVTNAIIHGYRNRPDRMVELDCRLEGETLIFCVRDAGCGMADVELARQPFYTTAREMERSGMGFAVMEAFMDEVQVASTPGTGTSVTLKKTIRTVRDDG